MANGDDLAGQHRSNLNEPKPLAVRDPTRDPIGLRKPRVVVSERLGPITAIELRLENEGALVESAPLWTRAEIASNARDASIVILGAVEPFDGGAMDEMPRLVAVVRRGVGYDNIDVAAATERGIIVANVPDASVEEVSDHALALLFSLERAIPWLDSAVRAGAWQRDPSQIAAIRASSRRFSALTLGIVGLGRIGRAVARKAQSVYGRIIGSDPLVTPSEAEALGVSLVDVYDLLAAADHVSIHAPLLPETHHLINADTLRAARPGAVIVNTSRGALIDERALLGAIATGRVRAAGLDVTEHEPLSSDDPLLGAEKVVLTAHSASTSTTTALELAGRSVDAAVALLRGVRPDSLVNPEVLDSPNLRHRALSIGPNGDEGE